MGEHSRENKSHKKDVIVGKSLGDMSLGEWRGLPGTGKQGWEVMGCKIGRI